jgi:hypothetical protein
MTRSHANWIRLPLAAAVLACVVFATLDRLTLGPHIIGEPPRPRVVPKPFVAPPTLPKAAQDLPSPPPIVAVPQPSLPPLQLPPLPTVAVLWTIEAGQVRRSTDRALTWQTVSIAPDAVFRAAAQIGPRVWAGGDHGALYCSTDLGAHWTRASVPGLTGAITSIASSPSLDLRIQTASEGSWKSPDAGLHWIHSAEP